MKHTRWILPILILLLTSVMLTRNLDDYFEQNRSPILTSPGGLAMYPVAFVLPVKPHYFETYNKKMASVPRLNWFQSMSPALATAFLYMITGLFVYIFARVRKIEKAYLIFTIFLSLFLLLFLEFLTYNRIERLFYFSAVIIASPNVYLFRSIYGISTRWIFHMTVFLIALIVAVFMPTGKAEMEKLFFSALGIFYVSFLIYCVGILVLDTLKPDKFLSAPKPSPRRILAVTFIFSIAVTPILLVSSLFFPIKLDMGNNIAIFLPAIFPMIFFVLSFRFGLTYFDVPVSGTMVRISYFIFFSLGYWFTIGFRIEKIPYYSERIWIHGISLVIILFLVDPIRTVFYFLLNRYFLRKRLLLEKYLRESTSNVNNPRQISFVLIRLLDTVKEGLGVRWVKLAFSREVFKDWHFENENVLFIEADHPVWNQVKPWKKTSDYPVFTQAAVGPIRDMLQEIGGFLFVSLKNFKAMMIISDKKDASPIFSEDVSFIRQVLMRAEPLIQNYSFLIENIRLRKREQELELNARIQRKIIPGYKEFSNLEFSSYFKPSESVTGDYIDLVTISENRYVVFLGDVSGHGLSSAYLMSFIRSFMRGQLMVQGVDLVTTFKDINDFMCRNYRGSDFMTLFGLEIILSNKKIELNFVNAGQHPALVYLMKDEKVIKLSNSQRLLGVVATDYKPDTLIITQNVRVFLYSDGAFEAFNKTGKMLGHQKLEEWMTDTIQMPVREQTDYIKGKILSFLHDHSDMDDLSLVLMDIKCPSADQNV